MYRLSDINYRIVDETTTKSKVVHFNRLKACNAVVSKKNHDTERESNSDDNTVEIPLQIQPQQLSDQPQPEDRNQTDNLDNFDNEQRD